MFHGLKTGATYVGGHRVLLKAANGFKMYVDSSDISIAPHLILDGVWEEWTEAVLRRIVRPGMTVFEAGANVGYFTLVMARAVGEAGRVVSFECDPGLAMLARNNIEINGLHRTARIDQRALGDREGPVTFYCADRHRAGGSLVAGLEQIPHNATDTRSPIEVSMTTLDAFAKEAGIQPDFLKLDAEGAEPAILRGGGALLESDRPLTIVMEFFPQFVRDAGDDPAAVLRLLERQRFAFNVIDERHRRVVPATIDELLARENAELVLVRGATT